MAGVTMATIVANVANLMSEATAPCMGRSVINARVLIISKPFVIPRLQPRQCRASLKQEVTAATETWLNREQQWPWQRRWQTSTLQEEDAKEATKAECI